MHQVEAAVCGRLAVEMQGVESLRAGGGDPAAREQARVQLVPEPREVEIPDAERAVDPDALAERAAHDAVEERQLLGEHDVLSLDDRLPGEILPQKVVEGREPEDAAVDEQHAGHGRDQCLKF